LDERMTLSYEPDPRTWVRIPTEPEDGWAAGAARTLAEAQNVADRDQLDWLQVVLNEAASADRGDEDARWLCAADVRRGGIVVDLDIVDLGDDVPDEVDVDDAAEGQTEEFSAGAVHGKRIIWVTPADAGAEPAADADAEALQGQVLYVGRSEGRGCLVTMRSLPHRLELIVDSVNDFERMLATMRV
jgi:hypothetical protein